MAIDLKVAQLRKRKGISQQELAEHLGVTFQSVSKWETKSTFPDITLLPEIADFFEVSVDELLGIVPIRGAAYIPRDTDNRETWDNRVQLIENNRPFFWNDDYLAYLVKEVWKLDEPADLIEFCCCDGDFGKRLMKLLPEGSTYTGVDSQFLIKKAEENFKNETYPASFLASDLYEVKFKKKYDLCVCQASLRHMNQPVRILEEMKEAVKEGGMVICAEVNREIENVGTYIDGIAYDRMCASFDWRKLWLAELKREGRDYAAGVRTPFYMQRIGLRDVDVRLNDKVTFVTPSHKDYSKIRDAWIAFQGYEDPDSGSVSENMADFFMSRGYKRTEVEALYRFRKEIKDYIEENREQLSFLHTSGFLISYGRR